jgi:hypothetical protein
MTPNRVSPPTPLLKRVAWPICVFAAVFAYLAFRVPSPEFLLSRSDQGYQMALGMAVAKGHLPGLDFITQYGPGVAFASFLAFALTGNAVGEMLASILGYSLAITLGSEIVRRSVGWKWALLAALGMLVWFPRFYKWYYCLLPLLSLVAAKIDFAVVSRGGRRLPILAGWSLLVGLTGLFRYDLGLEGCVFGLLAIVAARYTNGGPRWRADTTTDATLFTCGALVIPALYAAWIAIAGDPPHLTMFIRSIYDGAADTVNFYAIAPFQFDLKTPLSDANALAFLQVAVPVTCLAGCVSGLHGLSSGSKALVADGFTLFCTSLVGVGIYPQSIHRADLQHLLQVEYPFIMVLALLLGRLAARNGGHAATMKLAGAAWLTIVFGAAYRLLPGAAIDLGPLSLHAGRHWWAVAALPASRPQDAGADMAMALRRLTPPGASVFLVMTPTDMPMLFFGQRHQAGIFPVYERGMFSNAYWLALNRTALTASPPDFLVVRQGANDDPAPFMPDVVSQWFREYRTTLYENGGYRLLAR